MGLTEVMSKMKRTAKVSVLNSNYSRAGIVDRCEMRYQGTDGTQTPAAPTARSQLRSPLLVAAPSSPSLLTPCCAAAVAL